MKKSCILNLSILSLILALCLAFASCNSYNCDACQDKDPACSVCSSEQKLENEEPQVEPFTLTANAKVIRGSQCNTDTLIDALNTLRDAGESLVGQKLTLSDDWYRGELVRHELEILVGHTNRPESVAAEDSLTYYDYMYKIVSPSCVVICGGSDESTLLAVEKFLSDCYGYKAGESAGELKTLNVGTSYEYKHEYKTAKVSLCGETLSDYTIVYPDGDANAYSASLLRRELTKVSGVNLTMSPISSFNGGNAIFVGCAQDGKHLYNSFGTNAYIVKYEKGDSNTVIIDAKTGLNDGKVVKSFADEILSYVPDSGSYNIELTEGERMYCSKMHEEFNGLRLEKTETTDLGNGVVYQKLTYKDENGKPVIAYAAIADMSKVTAINATPNYADVTVNAKATTLQAMKSAASAGYTVIAGVNADFFAISGDYHPSGLCVKQGKELLGANSRPWFGITKDGKALIGTGEQYDKNYKGNILEAVGGSHIILKNGFYDDIGTGTDFSYTRHPRTAVGITGDNKLIIMVVDGRQSTLSNGASLTDLAYIMASLGARDALNLDGGGSSSFITCKSGTYTTQNSPSDGSLRKVYNSLVFVKKQ